MRKPVWVFFDVGETLMDETATNRAWAEVVQEVAGAAGLRFTVEEILRAQRAAAAGGYSNPKDGAVALLAGEAADDLVRAARAKGWPLLDEPFPDAHTAIEALVVAGFRLGVIANQPTAVAQARLEWSGLLEHVEVALLSGDVGLMKPDPAIFRLALSMAGCEAAEAIIVGDRLDNDVAPAKRVGMGAVWLRRGLHADCHPRTGEEEADLTVGSLMELVERLTALA